MTSPKKPSAPGPRFVGPGAFRVVPLQFPLEYDGVVYNEIKVLRLSAKQVNDFVEAVGEDSSAKLPVIEGPSEVLDYLFPDDLEEVNKVIEDFLPRVLRTVRERALETTGATPQPSPPSSTNDSPISSNSSGDASSGSTSTPSSVAES